MQIPLPLAYREAHGEADFFVSSANRDAVALLDAWRRWPVPAALLLGPAGAGKSHLARLFARRAGAHVIDDLQPGADETHLFHAWNAASPVRPLLLVARTDPARWPVRLPDLASRLAATPRAIIGPPDDALLAAVIAKRFRDRGVSVPAELVHFLIARIERSFAAAANAVERLDAAALAARRPVTIPLARNVLFGGIDWLA